MKCHQILTGACNPGDKTFGVGSVEGKYVNIILLINNFGVGSVEGKYVNKMLLKSNFKDSV